MEATLKSKSNDCSILKSRDITLPIKVRIVKAKVFPVVMYGCESWTIKKTERQRIDAFELWCWKRLLRVPWTILRSNQSILRRSVLGVHWKDWCWSWNSNTLGPPHAKNWLIGKDLDAGKDWRQEEKGMPEDEMVGWYHRLDGHEFGWTPGVMDREAWCAAVHGVTKSWIWLSNWTEWSI